MSHGEDSLANQAGTELNWGPACGPQDFCKTKILNLSHLCGGFFIGKNFRKKL
jgi:hypothetical protein